MTAPPERLDASDFVFEPHAVRLFQVKDIVSLQAGGNGVNYTEITLSNGRKVSVRKTLAQIFPRLPSCFFPARRGRVINLHHVRDLAQLDRRRLNVTLSDFSQVEISRKQLISLARHLGL